MEKLSEIGNIDNLEQVEIQTKSEPLADKIKNSFNSSASSDIINSMHPNYNQDVDIKIALKEQIQNKVFEQDIQKKERQREDKIEQELKEQHEFVELVEQHVDELDAYSDYKVEDLISGKEYKRLLKLRKSKIETQHQQETGPSGSLPPLKVGKMRVARDHKDKELMQTIKDSGLKEKDYSKVVEKLKKTIDELETAAKKIEETHDFYVKEPNMEEKNNALKFLLTTNILTETMMFNGSPITMKQRGLSRKGIDQDEFLNSYNILQINSGDAPRSIIEVPLQLAYINRLNKLFNSKFIQEADSNLKFTDIDRSICSFLLSAKPNNHNLTKTLLDNLLKKMILLTFSTVESAFRSTNIWIKPEFKSLIKSEIVMMQGLPPYLKQSFNAFVTELLELERAQIFNRSERLDYVIHVNTPCIIEQTLARIIKTMTPMFIYDYFEAIKSIYLFCGLFEVYLDRWVMNKDGNKKSSEEMRQDVDTIVKVAVITYQNTRLYQNSTARSLPHLEESTLSEQAQMYYLNHTLVGPQYQLLRCFEKAIPALI